MCNRYRGSDIETIRQTFGARLGQDTGHLPPGELFPKRPGYVVRKQGEERIVDVMTWGFPPPAAGRAPVTNVRNLASSFWRSALSRPDRRCLVPVTSFCEWSGEKGSKVEHWFSVREAPVFAFAGIWRPTEDGAAYAFLTCEPNPLVKPMHGKAMPVIVAPEDYDVWLDGEVATACALAAPFPSQLMLMAEAK